MIAISFALHVTVVVIALLAPWEYFGQRRPPLVSYTVDLVASDKLGGNPAPKSAPGAPRGVPLPPVAKPEGKAAAKPPAKAAAAPAKKAESQAKPPPKPEPKKVAPEPKPDPQAKAKAEAEAKAKKAKADAEAKAKVEAKAKAEREAKIKAQKDAKAKAEREAKAKAEKEAKAKAEKEAKAKAEQEAKAKAEREAKAKADKEAKAKAEREAKAKAEKEAKEKAEREAKAKAEAEAKEKADAKAKADAVAAKLRDEHLAAAIERLRGQDVAADNEVEGGTGLGGSGGGGAVQGLDFLLYKGVVENSIRQNWAWAGDTPGLVVVVGFGIQADGRIVDLGIVEPSGDSTYDALALRAVQSSDPLPPPPEAYRNEFSRYELELRAEDMGH